MQGINLRSFVNIPELFYVDIVKSTICSLEKPTALIFRTNCVPRLRYIIPAPWNPTTSSGWKFKEVNLAG